MWTVHRKWSRLTCIGCSVGTAMLMWVAMTGIVGCSACPKCGKPGLEEGYCDQNRTQIQFFAPPGATVTVCDKITRSHEVATYGPYGNRLEQSPEEFSVFNLHPGTYEFKYTSAEGLPGVSVYGELVVKHPGTPKGKMYQRRSFVPIALPSEYYRHVEVTGDELFPHRGEAYRAAIDTHDLERLSQGDVVEKVFFVADLEDADKRLKEAQIKLAAIEREIEYAEARFRYAYLDFRTDVTDPTSNFFGTDRQFIEWEKKRNQLEQKRNELQAKVDQKKSLLKADHAKIRNGLLAVSTEELLKPYRDVEEASNQLGDVLLVMRVGGRHMHWGDAAQEQIAREQ